MKEYTYYEFWDALCTVEEGPDYYRMGPGGFQFRVEIDGEAMWTSSGFADMDDLMANAVGEGRFKEIDVD